MTQRSVRRRNRILAGGVILIAFAAMWGQYSMWQRYGVFDWWSAQPRFVKVLGRDYERGRFHNPPTPHYCIIDTMFPFAYPIAADVVGGPDGRRCDLSRDADRCLSPLERRELDAVPAHRSAMTVRAATRVGMGQRPR